MGVFACWNSPTSDDHEKNVQGLIIFFVAKENKRKGEIFNFTGLSL